MAYPVAFWVYVVLSVGNFVFSEREAIKRIMRTLGSWLSRFRSENHSLLEWKFSGVILPTIFSFGVGMAIADNYTLAYLGFVFWGGWTLAFWLTSDVLRKRRQALRSRDVVRKQEMFTKLARSYYAWEWGGTLLIVLATIACIGATAKNKSEKALNDVFLHLSAERTIESGKEDDPMNTIFTVINSSDQKISSHHGVFCYTKFAVGGAGSDDFVAGIESTKDEDGTMRIVPGPHLEYRDASSILDRGGDAVSNECLKWIHFSPSTSCADVTVIFWYALDNYPTIGVPKYWRFQAVKGVDKFTWIPESINSKQTFCLDTYKGDKAKLPKWLFSQ